MPYANSEDASSTPRPLAHDGARPGYLADETSRESGFVP